MQRIEQGKADNYKQLLLNILINRRKLPEFLEKFFFLLQYFSFTVFITSQLVQHPNYPTQQLTLKIMIALVLLILTQAFIHIQLIRPIYVILMVWICTQEMEVFLMLNIILIIFNIGVDILNSIEISVCSQNPHSETLNFVKIVHYLVMIMAIVLKYKAEQLIGESWIINLISLIAFIILIILKVKSKYKSQQFKQLSLRFYTLTCFYFALNITTEWVSVAPVYSHIIVICLSQLLYTLLQYRLGRIELSSYLSQKHNFKLFFLLMSYIFSNRYSAEYEKVIGQFEGNTLFEDEIDKKPDEDDRSKSLYMGRTELISRLMQLLENEEETLNLLLKAQLKFYMFKQIVNVKKIIEKINGKIGCLSWIEKLCVYKLDLEVKEYVESQKSVMRMDNLQMFMENQKIRIELIRISQDYVNLWEYMRNSELVFEKLKKLLKRVIKRKEILHNQYKQTLFKCNSIIKYYIDYLFLVEKNIERANEVSRQTYLLQDIYSDMHTNEKIYLLLGVEDQDFFVIQNIGFNVFKQLGYERNELHRINASLLLPSFYRKFHDQVLHKKIKVKGSEVCLFRKRTIIRHHQKYYLPCNIVLRMVENSEGKLLYEGYIEIVKNEEYEWKNYLMVNEEDNEIVELGPQLECMIYVPKNSNLNAQQFFQEIRSESSIQEEVKKVRTVVIDGITYKYNLIKQLVLENNKFCLYVCLNDNSLIPQELENLSMISIKTEKNLNIYSPYPIDKSELNIGEYFESRKEVQEKVHSGGVYIMVMVSILLLVCIIGIEMGSLKYMMVLEEENQANIEKLQTVQNYYLSLNKLCMIMNMFYLKSVYGYEIGSFSMDIQKQVLDLQDTNEDLSEFSKQFYGDEQWVFNKEMSVNQIIVNFISEIYSINYIQDSHLTLLSLSNGHRQLHKIIIDSYYEYYNGLSESYQNAISINNVVNLILILAVVCISIVILILMIKMEEMIRSNEYAILLLFTKIRGTPTLITPIHNFIFELVGSSNEIIDAKEADLNYIETNDLLKSNMSSRENTRRDLMEEPQSRRSNFGTEQNINMHYHSGEKVTKEKEEIKNKIKGRSKKFVLVVLLIFICVTSLHCVNGVRKVNNENFSLVSSILNMMKVLKSMISHSVITIGYVDGISHDEREIFERSMARYRDISEEEIGFAQINYEEFREFKRIWENIQYSYLCQYTECKDQYKEYINIILSTTSEKLRNYMKSNYADSEITNNTFQFQALIYFQEVVQNVVSEYIQTYVNNYHVYYSSISQNQFIFNGLIITCAAVSIFLLLLFTLLKIKTNNRAERQMLLILRPQSFTVQQLNQ